MVMKRIRKPTQPATHSISSASVAWELAGSAERIATLEAERDTLCLNLDNCRAALTVEALNAPMFNGKAGTEPHAAGNDAERDAAIKDFFSRSLQHQTLRQQYEAAKRAVEQARSQQDNLHVLARLLLGN